VLIEPAGCCIGDNGATTRNKLLKLLNLFVRERKREWKNNDFVFIVCYSSDGHIFRRYEVELKAEVLDRFDPTVAIRCEAQARFVYDFVVIVAAALVITENTRGVN